MFGVEFWKIAASLGVPGFALAIAAFLFRKFDFNIPLQWQGPVASLFIVVVGGITLFAILAFAPPRRNWLAPVSLVSMGIMAVIPIFVIGSTTNDYLIHITVISPTGATVDEAVVTSSLGDLAPQTAAGWQLLVPKSRVPQDGKITLRATNQVRGWQGSQDITLTGDTNVSITIQMTQDSSAEIGGYVRDEQGQGVPGASVTHAASESVSDANGRFRLAANAPKGTEIPLHTECDGYRPTDQYAIAGDVNVVIVMRRIAP